MIETIEERQVYANAYVTVYDDRVRFPDGSEGTYYRSRWTAPFGVAVVPMLGERVLLINNYRYADRGWSLEIPMGFGTAEGSIEDNARRELQEETGLAVETLEPLFKLGGDYVTHVFVGRVPAGAKPNLAGLESSESVQGFKLVDRAAVTPAALLALGVRDALTLAALLAVAVA